MVGTGTVVGMFTLVPPSMAQTAHLVTVPPHVQAGEHIAVTFPSGRQCMVIVPQDLGPDR